MPETPSQTDTYNTALDIFDRTHPLRVDMDENLKVTGTFVTTPSGTQDVNITRVGGNPVTTTVPVSFSGNVTVVQPTGTNLHTVVDNFPAVQPISGTVAATQSGSWTVSLSSGSIEIGTVDQGHAGVESWLVDVTNTVPVTGTFFQATQPVSIASPIAVTQSGAWSTGRTWTLSSGTDSVNVGNFPATQPVSGTITANQGTSPWVSSISNFPAVQTVSVNNFPATQNVAVVSALPTGTNVIGHVIADSGSTTAVTGNVTVIQPTGTNLHAVIDSGTITLSGTSPVSGTVTANQGTPNTPANKWPIELVDSGGVNIATVDAAGDLQVDVNNFPATVAVTQSTSPWVVSGTVTANAGIGTFLVDGSAHTQPVSGTVAATQSGEWDVNIEDSAGNALTSTANALDVNIKSTGVTQPVSGTVTANQGTSPWVTSLASTTITGNVTVVQPTGTNLHTVVDSGTIAATQSGTWTTGRTWTLASGTDSVAAVQSGTWTVQPGNTPNTAPWLIEQRAPGIVTYSAATLGLAAAVTPTDIFTIYGSGTKTIKITYLQISATQNTAAIRDIVLIKRSAANTGGTSSSVTAVPYDSNSAGATATVLAYTANPASLGTSVGNVRTAKFDIPATNLVGSTDRIEWTFGERPSQAIVLRGTGQGLAVNLNSVTSASNSFDIVVEWTEE